jgi:hypothetical protein
MWKAKVNRIVFSEAFYKKVVDDLKKEDLPLDTGCAAHISGTYIEDFKGIPKHTELRFIEV